MDIRVSKRHSDTPLAKALLTGGLYSQGDGYFDFKMYY